MTALEIFQTNQLIKEEILYLAHSRRNQLRILNHWLSRLLTVDNPILTEAYLLEMGAQLLMHLDGIPIIGTAPSFFQELGQTITELEIRTAIAFTSQEFSRAKIYLHQCIDTMNSFLGMPDGLDTSDAQIARKELSVLRLSPTNPIDAHVSIRSHHRAHFSDERGMLDHFIHHLRSTGDARLDSYLQIAEAWDKQIRVQPGSVNIPLIEEDLTGGMIQDFCAFGSISELFNAISPLDARAERDVINISNGTNAAAHANTQEGLRNILEAVRTVLPLLSRNGNGKFYHVTAGYTDHTFQYTGQSLGVGTTVNLLTLLTQQNDDHAFYIVNPSAVFTGCIDREGFVLALDEKMLDVKVQTVFFSPYSALVLPKENELFAEQRLDELTRDFPARKLELIPVRHVKDVFNNRLAVTHSTRTLPNRIGRRITRNTGRIALGAAALCVLLVATYLLMIADFDKNPARFAIDKKYFIIQNVNQKMLWRKLINPYDGAENGYIPDPNESKQWISIADIDGDGLNEVFLTHSVARKYFSDTVRCYGADGNILWRKPVGKPTVTNENDYSSQPFAVYAVSAERREQSQYPLIFSIARNENFAYFVNTFSQQGKITGEYYHAGRISTFERLQSRVNDGNEVMFTGRHNGFKKPCAFILDMNYLSGKCPQEKTHELISPEMPSACEKYYILFPDLDIQDTLRDYFHHVAYVEGTDSTIVIRVEVAYMPEKLRKRVNQTASITYIFDRNMNPIAVSSGSDFDNLFHEMVSSGQITSAWNETYRKNLMRRILYWDGDKFVTTPTMNKRYLEAVQKKTR